MTEPAPATPGRPRPCADAVAHLDRAVDRAFERVRGTQPADRVLYALSELGDFSLLWHLAGWQRALRHPDEVPAAIRLSVCLGIESVLVNGVVKGFFRRERPASGEPRPHRLRTPRTTSFPSGHASSAMVAATLLADRGRRGGEVWWAVAALVAASRVHVRIHHASDVVGGAALGLALGAVMRRAWPLPR